jgi:hypothetical protein
MTSRQATETKQKHPRVSISVDRDVGEGFALQAGHAGNTLYAFANQWLATASKISAEGGTAHRTIDEWKVCSVFRDVEVIPLPADFVEEMVEGLCYADREKALRTFKALGENLVSLMKIYAPDIDQLAALAKGFAGIAPLKRLDIERVDGDSIVLSAIGAGRKFEVTECAFEFVKSILNGYGYAVTAFELGVGTIKVEAKPRESARELGTTPVQALQD